MVKFWNKELVDPCGDHRTYYYVRIPSKQKLHIIWMHICTISRGSSSSKKIRLKDESRSQATPTDPENP